MIPLKMPDIRMRPKHQVTIPASIMRLAQIKPDDTLSVTYLNGSIIITPKVRHQEEINILSFAGIGRGLWGDTVEDVDATLLTMKDAWER